MDPKTALYGTPLSTSSQVDSVLFIQTIVSVLNRGVPNSGFRLFGRIRIVL